MAKVPMIVMQRDAGTSIGLGTEMIGLVGVAADQQAGRQHQDGGEEQARR